MEKLSFNWRKSFGLVMLALGSLLLVQMYIMGQPPKVGTKAVATIFGVFFILRGALYLRMSRSRHRSAD